jgi:hypothetical protein
MIQIQPVKIDADSGVEVCDPKDAEWWSVYEGEMGSFSLVADFYGPEAEKNARAFASKVMENKDETAAMREALEALLDWGRDHLSPVHHPGARELLVRAHHALGRETVRTWPADDPLGHVKAAVEAGKVVHWKSPTYRVIKDSKGQWFIIHDLGHCVPLEGSNPSDFHEA